MGSGRTAGTHHSMVEGSRTQLEPLPAKRTTETPLRSCSDGFGSQVLLMVRRRLRLCRGEEGGRWAWQCGGPSKLWRGERRRDVGDGF
ncbi:Pentatricopeptide repeat superfamily protein [Perilla frutescens var. hirtella]|nr:Pentatricopeptide repeat superfamily protein [Perilla frutescens var. hirtella]